MTNPTGAPEVAGRVPRRATPEQIAAAWKAFRGERKGTLLGPGPAFVEAINAALAADKPR